MNDREQIIQLIKELIIPYWAELIADHLIANGVAVQKWIPVTERLPEREKDVLVYDADNDEMHVWAFIADADGDGWVDAAGNMRPWLDATHWMPLPEPPEMDG